MSDGMGRELAYLSSHATNRYFIPNWGCFWHKTEVIGVDMRIKRDIINKFKEWKDAENPCRGKGRKLCQWKKYCCVQRTLPTQEPHTFLVSQFTAKLRNVSLSLALSRVGCEMVAQIIISYSRDTYRLFLFFYRQRQCKPNAMKFSSIAEAPPVLFK